MVDSASPSGTSSRSTEMVFRKTAALLASLHRGTASLERPGPAARNRGPAAASSTDSIGSWACATPIAPAVVIPTTRATTAPHCARPYTLLRMRPPVPLAWCLNHGDSHRSALPLVAGADGGGDEREDLCDRLVAVGTGNGAARQRRIGDADVEVVPSA